MKNDESIFEWEALTKQREVLIEMLAELVAHMHFSHTDDSCERCKIISVKMEKLGIKQIKSLIEQNGRNVDMPKP